MENAKFRSPILVTVVPRNEFKKAGVYCFPRKSGQAVQAVNGTTRAVRQGRTREVPQGIKEMSEEAATCRNPMSRKVLRKRAR